MTLGKWIGVASIGAAAVMGLLAFAAERAVSDREASLGAISQQVETRHGTLQYAEWGTGPPVIVLHGAGGGFDQGRLLASAAVAFAGSPFPALAIWAATCLKMARRGRRRRR